MNDLEMTVAPGDAHLMKKTSAAVASELWRTRSNSNPSQSVVALIWQATGCSIWRDQGANSCPRKPRTMHISGPQDGALLAFSLLKKFEGMCAEETVDISLSTGFKNQQVQKDFKRKFGVHLLVKIRVSNGESLIRVTILGIQGAVKEAIQELHKVECQRQCSEPLIKPPGLELDKPPGLELDKNKPSDAAHSAIREALLEISMAGCRHGCKPEPTSPLTEDANTDDLESSYDSESPESQPTSSTKLDDGSTNGPESPDDSESPKSQPTCSTKFDYANTDGPEFPESPKSPVLLGRKCPWKSSKSGPSQMDDWPGAATRGVMESGSPEYLTQKHELVDSIAQMLSSGGLKQESVA